MKTAIWWIRRDLRLTDNQALAKALAQADEVLPVFVLDPHILNRPTTGSARVAFMLGGLRQLDASLHQLGSRLVVRRGVREMRRLPVMRRYSWSLMARSCHGLT